MTRTPDQVKGFTRMPTRLARDPSIPPDVYAVTATVLSYEIRGKAAYPSQTTVGREWGRDRQWAGRALAQAEELGLVRKVGGGNGHTLHYRTTLPDDGVVADEAPSPRNNRSSRGRAIRRIPAATRADGTIDAAAENRRLGLTADGRDPLQVAAEESAASVEGV